MSGQLAPHGLVRVLAEERVIEKWLRTTVRLDDVPSIMLRMKEVYPVPDRHIRYTATKVFFGTKMTEGSSVQSHGVKMLSLVEKLEDLKTGLE
ncbi:UNVERIFIED_CONTAM: hypothetical protein Slati_4262600 [Sesamum latifolium]|uniref:Uncharacterized protein n=1 Tax=Sesamum latifolium TaxID=2727402 RepID=A0AAW2TCQ7_9LAMI